MTWDDRHGAFADGTGDVCLRCGSRRRSRERSLHGTVAYHRWSRGLLACACWWDGVVLSLLRRGARDLRRGGSPRVEYFGLRAPRPDPDARARELEHRRLVRRAFIAAEAADVTLEGWRVRGPTYSRQAWDAEVAAADDASRRTWSIFAQLLLGDHAPLP